VHSSAGSARRRQPLGRSGAGTTERWSRPWTCTGLTGGAIALVRDGLHAPRVRLTMIYR
jgi:hypothetical protein